MYFYAAILLLFRPFIHGLPNDADQDPRAKCLEAAIYISQIWQRHRELFGFSGIWGFQVNCLLMASSVYAENMSEDHAIHWLREACSTLQDMAALHSWTGQSLHTLRGMMETSRVQLPQSVMVILYRGAPVPSAYQRAQQKQQQPHQYQPTPSAAGQSFAEESQRRGAGGGPQYMTSQQHGAAGTLGTPPSGFGAMGQYNPRDPTSFPTPSSTSAPSFPSRQSSAQQQEQASRQSGFTPPGWQEPFLRYMREYSSSNNGNGSGSGSGSSRQGPQSQ